jgi:hypothetical protein
MDSRKVCLSCLLLLGLAATALAQNSVAGKVLNKRTGAPVERVRVLIQPLGGAALRYDQTRSDGLFLLNVPKHISKYVIIFSRTPGYMDGLDCGDDCSGILNTEKSLKRPDMELLPQRATRNMPPRELQKLIDYNNRIMQLGDRTGTPGLRGTATKNLDLIRHENNRAIATGGSELEGRIRINEQLNGLTGTSARPREYPVQNTKRPTSVKPSTNPTKQSTIPDNRD